MPLSAMRMRRCALELERLGDHADGQDALFARRAGDTTGAAPVPVPPPMPAVMNTMCDAGQVIVDLVDHFFGRGTADFRLRPGAKTFRHGHAHLDETFGLVHGQRLGIGVGNDEVDSPAGRH
jgi:hypothetical protein